ncbi:Clp protease ClpP [Corynebacterium sanguinis]|uniref:head maturation protease, ClpP-related n=1 Tax=Corynebacterium sanguinis TaxID=2594913 RepID=UPI0021A882E8|nr:head maturation protease, ClpP-related [Corynebacterium sanguinis]MCT1491345.1 Clp protease ClpP [Corynebacterium sanguinis]MCT2246736.1 Clp protease ClpP [Corynebacterium sanguinis]
MNEILIYGDIGFEVQAKDIVNQLNDADGPLSVRVDSFGGDVYAGISILNALRRYPDVVTVYVDGIAASAASFIAVGGADKLIMSPNSSLLIHGAWSQGMGNSEEIAQLAKDLNQVTDNLATIYAEKTGKEPAYWRELMKKDTTFTAEQAVEAGLADAVAEFEKSAKAEKCHAVMASQRSRFAMAGGRGVPEIESRAAAPPPPISTPSDGQEGDGMNILNQLAQELGRKPEEVQDALSGFFNEAVTISGEVDVTYPADVRIVPTERITVDPTIGDKPAEGEQVEVVPDGTEPQPDSAAVQLAKSAGLTFVMGDIADGFEASVDEGGTVTIKAPSGVEPGDTAEFSVMVNETAVPLIVTVRGLSDEEDTSGEAAPVETAPAPDAVTLDRETYNDLRAAAQLGWKAMEQQKDTALVAEVDQWVAEGRISAGLRAKAVAAIRRDPQAARDIYGSNPAGTVPRAELGHGKDTEGTSGEVAAKADQAGILTRKNFH